MPTDIRRTFNITFAWNTKLPLLEVSEKNWIKLRAIKMCDLLRNNFITGYES